MVARGPGPHGGLGKPEREDPARVEEPAPGVRIHMRVLSSKKKFKIALGQPPLICWIVVQDYLG